MFDATIISDVHLGAHNCQSEILLKFLGEVKGNTHQTKKLIIAGDLFDSFNVRLRKEEWKVLGAIRALSNDIEIVWVKGNHDDFHEAKTVSYLLGAEFQPIHYIFETGEKKILVLHGDVFDTFLTDHPFLTWISDWIYWFLQRIDKSHNIAKFAKYSSKSYLHCSEIIAKESVLYAAKWECDIAIAGHTHLALKQGNYFNSGSWTELPASYLTVKDGLVELNYVSQI